jgi:hypothetical protein
MDNQSKNMEKGVWIVLMLVSYLVLTYSSRIFKLSAITGMILIILLSRKAWPESWSLRLGIKISNKAAWISIICFPFVVIVSHILVLKISGKHQISYISWLSDFSTIKYLHNFAQTFNEEMILGAFLLNAIRTSFKKLHPLLISLIVALLFAIFHYIFYSWLVVLPNHSGKLRLITLMTLFLVAIFRNTLILKTNHIAYAWVLHFGFNLVFLRGSFYDLRQDIYLNQPEVFNLILSSPIMVGIGILMFLSSLCLYGKKLKFLSK